MQAVNRQKRGCIIHRFEIYHDENTPCIWYSRFSESQLGEDFSGGIVSSVLNVHSFKFTV